MRIIKHGNVYELGQKTCPNCKCEFAYNKKDIQSIYNREDECDVDIVTCPECKHSIPVFFKEAAI